MPEDNRFESRFSRRRAGERIIDVEALLQGAASSSSDGEAPYMKSEPTEPQPPLPAPDQRESWPPTMISLAEGARVDNIGGRPIHEFTGIQPSNTSQYGGIGVDTQGQPSVGIESSFRAAIEAREDASIMRGHNFAATYPDQGPTHDAPHARYSHPFADGSLTRLIGVGADSVGVKPIKPITHEPTPREPCYRLPGESYDDWLVRCGVQPDPGYGVTPNPAIGDDDRQTAPPPKPQPLPPLAPKPKPLPTECTCALYCLDLESEKESPDNCVMELWCEAHAPSDTKYKFTPLRGFLELFGTGQNVTWKIKTSGQYPDKLLELSSVNPRNVSELRGKRLPHLSGPAQCIDGTRIPFAILPSGKALQKLIDGDMTAASEDVIAFLDGEECARFTVDIKVRKCDEEALKARAEARNGRSPNIVCFAGSVTAEPVSDASELPADPTGGAANAVLAITIDIELAIGALSLFECPDCCCEYYDHGFIWITVTAQWVNGARGVSKFAAAKQASFAEFFNSADFLDQLTAIVRGRYPQCKRSKECPQPLPMISFYTLGPYSYSLADIEQYRSASSQPGAPEQYCELLRPQAERKQTETLGNTSQPSRFFDVRSSDYNPPDKGAEAVAPRIRQWVKDAGHADLAFQVPDFLHAGLLIEREIRVTWEVLDLGSDEYDCYYVIAAGISINIVGTVVWSSNADDLKDRLRGQLVRNELLLLWDDFRAKVVDVPAYQQRVLDQVLRGLPHRCKSRVEATKFIQDRERYFREMLDPRTEIRTDDSPTHALTPFFAIPIDTPRQFGRPDLAPAVAPGGRSIDLRLKKFIGGTTYTVPKSLGGLEEVFVRESFTFCSPIGRATSWRPKEDVTIPKTFGSLGGMIREFFLGGKTLKFLTIEGHGNGTVINLSARAAQPLIGEAMGIHPQLFIYEKPAFLKDSVWAVPTTDLSYFVEDSAYAVELLGVILAPCFAPNAEVYLNVCAIGIREFAQFLADATNATIYAPAGCIAQGTNFDTVLAEPDKYIMLRPFPREPVWPGTVRELWVFRRHQPKQVWKP